MFSLYYIYVWNIVICLTIVVFFSEYGFFLLAPFESITPILIGMLLRKDIHKISDNIPLVTFYCGSAIFSLPMFLLSVAAILDNYKIPSEALTDISFFLMIISVIILPVLLISSVTKVGLPKTLNIRKHYLFVTSLLFIHNFVILGVSG